MAHLSHEASVRSVGSLYYLGGILTAIMLGSLIVVGVTSWDAFAILFAILFGTLTISFGIGRGLRTLRRSAQIFAGLISTLGLLAFPTLLLAFPTLAVILLLLLLTFMFFVISVVFAQ